MIFEWIMFPCELLEDSIIMKSRSLPRKFGRFFLCISGMFTWLNTICSEKEIEGSRVSGWTWRVGMNGHTSIVTIVPTLQRQSHHSSPIGLRFSTSFTSRCFWEVSLTPWDSMGSNHWQAIYGPGMWHKGHHLPKDGPWYPRSNQILDIRALL